MNQARSLESKVGSEWSRAVGIILLFLGLGFSYSLVVPPFETPDEIYHFAFVHHLAQGHTLPVQSPQVEAPWEQEGSQAPLYYLLAGWLTRGIDQQDFAQLTVPNPRANIGDPLFPGNKNFMLYSAVAHPWQGTNLALHVVRWFSLLLGALTLWFTYLTARLLFVDQPGLALTALLITALIPQFSFISAACSNDNLINAASAAVIYWLASLLYPSTVEAARSRRSTDRNGGYKPPLPVGEWWPWLILGLLLGIAALSKLHGLGLIGLSGLVILGLAWQRRDWALPLRVALPVGLPILLIAGWWYWRNYTLYGDWLGIGNLLANNGRREDELTLGHFWQEFRGLRYSFWGLFGWFNILLPQWVYVILDGVTVVGSCGLLLGWWRRKGRAGRAERPPFTIHHSPFSIHLLLLTWSLLSLALLLYWTSQATGSQGRLLFPAIGALVTLLVAGLAYWLKFVPPPWRWGGWGAVAGLLGGCSLWALTSLLPGSYAAPQPITTIPTTAQPVDVIYGEQDPITLLALDLPTARFRPGDQVPVTLYLQAQARPQADYQLFIQLLDETGREIGNLTSHPGWGRNPTTLWQPGAIYADSYPVLISTPIATYAPLWARVYVGFVDPQTETEAAKRRLPVVARNGAGEIYTDGPFVGHVAVSPLHGPEVADQAFEPVGTEFGGVIQLTAAHLPNPVTLSATSTLTVTLLWQAIGTPATDYTAFAQLRSAAGQPQASFDRAPAPDRFPTAQWRSGDQILSTLPLTLPADLPPATYDLWVGLYEAASQGALRLPITAPGMRTTGDGEVLVGQVLVRP